MLTILAVSDSIGETANQVAVAAASQFTEKVQVKIIQYKTLKPSEIKSVSLLKYGGDIQWTIWG